MARQKKHRKSTHRAAPKSKAIIKIAAPTDRPWQLNSEEVTIVKNNIAKGASDAELEYCLTVARRYRLDPFKQQIWFIKRWSKDADNGPGKPVGRHIWVPQVGIYGKMHVAARDHKDYGTMSQPEYGPIVELTIDNYKFRVPEWARVKVWKKGVSEPSVGEAYFEEYCPKDSRNQAFWRNMPRRMLAKCAKSQAISEGYPDLGGLYIPEEMHRMTAEMEQDFPSEGHTVFVDGVSPSGLLKSPEKIHQQIKETKAQIVERKTQELKQKMTEPTKQEEVRAGTVSRPFRGELELDWSLDERSPIVRGDLTELLEELKFECEMKWGKDEWWHMEPRYVETLRAICELRGFQLKEILPKKVDTDSVKPRTDSAAKKGSMAGPSSTGATAKAGGTQRSKPGSGDSVNTPTVANLKGIIEQANPEQERQRPVVQVLFKIDGKKSKYWLKAYDHKLFPHLIKGKDREAILIVEKRVTQKGTFYNIKGLKLCAGQDFDDDGFTPVIQQSKREAGQRTLY